METLIHILCIGNETMSKMVTKLKDDEDEFELISPLYARIKKKYITYIIKSVPLSLWNNDIMRNKIMVHFKNVKIIAASISTYYTALHYCKKNRVILNVDKK